MVIDARDVSRTRVALGLAIEGTIGFYGRATAIGWEACEEIESVRAEVLRQRGYASGHNKLQIHASRDAGGGTQADTQAEKTTNFCQPLYLTSESLEALTSRCREKSLV